MMNCIRIYSDLIYLMCVLKLTRIIKFHAAGHKLIAGGFYFYLFIFFWGLLEGFKKVFSLCAQNCVLAN